MNKLDKLYLEKVKGIDLSKVPKFYNDSDGFYATNNVDSIGEFIDVVKRFARKYNIGTMLNKQKWGSRAAQQIQDQLLQFIKKKPEINEIEPVQPKVLNVYDDLKDTVDMKRFSNYDVARVARTETARIKAISQLLAWKQAGLKYVRYKTRNDSKVGSDHQKLNNKEYSIDFLLSKQGESVRIPNRPNCLEPNTYIKTKFCDIYIKHIVKYKLSVLVKSHKKRWRKVTGWHKNFFVGFLYNVKGVWMTGEHLVYEDGSWVEAKHLTEKKKLYIGFVYNLSVDKDESYSTEDLVVHNCRCRYEPSMRGL